MRAAATLLLQEQAEFLRQKQQSELSCLRDHQRGMWGMHDSLMLHFYEERKYAYNGSAAGQ